MNTFIAKYLMYLPAQELRGQHISRFMKSAEAVQYYPLERILKIRDEKIHALIKYAAEYTPFYRDLFKKHGINPDSIKGYNDLINIPLLSKQTILQNEKAFIHPSYGKKLFQRKTGGSTGMTLHFYKEGDALAKNDAIMWRCYKWYNIDVGDRQVRFWGVPVTHERRSEETRKDFLCNRIRVSAFDISREVCLREWKRIKQFKPAYFYGYTTAIYGFCRHLRDEGIDLNELKLKAVICTAEKMYSHHRKLFDEVFSCPVVDEYGSTENGIISFQCKEGNMHLMSDHLAVEFVDEKGMRINPGETGSIIITDLSSYAMPMIRYNIADMGGWLKETCDCGVNLPLMKIVEGRKEDFIRTREEKLVHAAYLCYTLKEDFVHEFKMYQQAVDRFLVQIVKAPSWNEASELRLRKNLGTALGEASVFNFEYLEAIPRETSGKLRYFVSELDRRE